jgi:hypothetical protein
MLLLIGGRLRTVLSNRWKVNGKINLGYKANFTR